MSFSKQEQQALKLYSEGNYDDALSVSLDLSRNLNSVGLFMSGVILELGISAQGKNLLLAYKHFDLLRKNNDEEGYIGCARIMMEDHSIGSAKLASEYCIEALTIRKNPYAHLLLGQVYELMFGVTHYKQATTSYLKAALYGAAQGWRRIALLEIKKGNRLSSVIIHIFATIVTPLYIFFGGLGSVRNS